MTTTRMTRRLAALAATTPLFVLATGLPASAETEVDRPDSFTSAYTVMATPDTIINTDGEAVPGLEGATGSFSFMINSDEEIVCYDIKLTGVDDTYSSPAKTATHVHAAPAGMGGPPRLAFPNPEGDGDTRTSSGCLKGPFTTGLEGDDGNDTGEGFTLSEIEADAANFSADTHTDDFKAGAVRGQLVQMPVGGVDTGAGGLAADGGVPAPLIGLAGAAGLAALAAAGVGVAIRRERA